MLSFAIRNRGNYAVASVFVGLAVAVVSSATYLLAFFVLADIAAFGTRADGQFKLVDPSVALSLLHSSPSDPRLWWLYALMAFNLIPLIVNLSMAIFGFLSWQTPPVLAERYADYIKREFKGDYPRLVETSAFLAARLVLSVTLSLGAIGTSIWALKILFPRMIDWVVKIGQLAGTS